MDHQEIQRKLSAYLDNAVSPGEKEEIKKHLSGCGSCRGALADLELAVWHVKKLPKVDPPSWLTESIMTKAQEPAVSSPALWRRLSVKLPLGVAAMVVICCAGYYLTRTVSPRLPLSMPNFLQKRGPSPKVEQPSTGPPATPTAVPTATFRTSSPSEEMAPEMPPSKGEGGHAGTSATLPHAPVPAASVRRHTEPELPPSDDWGTPDKEPERSLSGDGGTKRAKRELPDQELPAAATSGVVRAGEVGVSLRVTDAEVAAGAIEKAVTSLGGRINGRAYSQKSHLLYVRIETQKFQELVERLARIGKVTERPQLPEEAENSVDLVVAW